MRILDIIRLCTTPQKPTIHNCFVGSRVLIGEKYDWFAGKIGLVMEIEQVSYPQRLEFIYMIKLLGIIDTHRFYANEFLVLESLL